MPTLSVILISKNESANIRDCLQSVSWADEIIVVDSCSTDDTATLPRKWAHRFMYLQTGPDLGRKKIAR